MIDPRWISLVAIEYPPGAGGAWLSAVLACAITGRPWVWNTQPNFHDRHGEIFAAHWVKNSRAVIGLHSAQARYNFWIYYWGKRVLPDLRCRRYDGRHWVNSGSDLAQAKQQGSWLLSVCQRIHEFPSQHDFQIDWINMINQPDQAWRTVCAFLEQNRERNRWSLSQWQTAVQNYRATIWSPRARTTHRVAYRIWAVAWLASQGISAPFDVFVNFYEPCLQEWLGDFADDIEHYTQTSTYQLG